MYWVIQFTRSVNSFHEHAVLHKNLALESQAVIKRHFVKWLLRNFKKEYIAAQNLRKIPGSYL